MSPLGPGDFKCTATWAGIAGLRKVLGGASRSLRAWRYCSRKLWCLQATGDGGTVGV